MNPALRVGQIWRFTRRSTWSTTCDVLITGVIGSTVAIRWRPFTILVWQAYHGVTPVTPEVFADDKAFCVYDPEGP